jgi:hypothetical protein
MSKRNFRMLPRTSSSNQRARPVTCRRNGKTMLLPMPRQDSDRVSLQNHLILAALEARHGSAFGLHVLLKMVLLTGFIDLARSQQIRPEVLVEAEGGISEAFSRGEKFDQWYLDDQSLKLCGELVTWHDWQLQTTPLHILENANNRLERLRASTRSIQLSNR